MAAMDKLHILKSVIIHIVQSHHPPSGNVHVILLKFKMATTNQLFVGGAIGPPRLLSWSREIFGTKSEVSPFIKPVDRSISLINRPPPLRFVEHIQ